MFYAKTCEKKKKPRSIFLRKFKLPKLTLGNLSKNIVFTCHSIEL